MATMQNFFAKASAKAVDDLWAALMALPEEKRSWKPADGARSARNQIAECHLMNAHTVTLLEERKLPPNSMKDYAENCARLETLPDSEFRAAHDESTAAVIAAISAVPDADLENEILMPWGPITISDIIAYTYWNATYHQGQINYIGSLLPTDAANDAEIDAGAK